ncbi:EamA family transporter [Oryzisolibacter sp. LB2S]|uniref:EamA family transporter n=1 Tax=Alicycliphilus soli TaxID=3228789 RepID=UPI003459F87F
MNMRTAFSGREVAAALAVVLIWGLNFVAMKLALREFTPMQLGAWRYVFAAAPLLVLLRRPPVPLRWLALYGLVQGLGQFGLLFLALQWGMTAAVASVLMQTQVFFTALLGWFLLQERLTPAQAGGLGLALLGLVCFGMHFSTLERGGPGLGVTGFVLTLGAAAMWGASSIVARRLQQRHPGYDAVQFVVWSSLFPILPFLALSHWLDGPQALSRLGQISWTAWGGAAYLGLFATVVAYGLWTWLLKRRPANQVAPIGLGVPVIGLLAGVWLLDERLSAWQWAGIAGIAASLVYAMTPRTRKAAHTGAAVPPIPAKPSHQPD